MPDYTLPLVGAIAVLIVGLIMMVRGSKVGMLLLAGGAVWAYFTLQPVISASQAKGTTPDNKKQGYYNSSTK